VAPSTVNHPSPAPAGPAGGPNPYGFSAYGDNGDQWGRRRPAGGPRRRPVGRAVRVRRTTVRSPTTGNVAWLILGACTVGVLYPVPAVINVVRTYRSAQGQEATGLGTLRVGLTRVWAIWAAVFIALSLIAYPLLILAGSSSNSSTSSGPVAPPVTVNVPLGTTESIAALGPGGTDQEPATLRMSDLVYPAPGSPTEATAQARICAGGKTIDPLSGVVDVSLVDSSGRQHGPNQVDTLPDSFYAGHLAPHACLNGTLSFTVPSGTTPRSLTLFGIDLKTINWSAS
jgi:hypothetical protein